VYLLTRSHFDNPLYLRKESQMLVLSRKKAERILVGDNVVITIVRIGPHSVRVGIEAPPDTVILRGELEQADSECETPPTA